MFLKVLRILVISQCMNVVSVVAQTEGCSLDSDLSPECITKLGLDKKVVAYEQKIADAQRRYGTSYKIRLRVAGSFMFMAEYPNSEVFTDVVHDDDMRNESFIITVSAHFLEKQPEILFEHSALHEVAHIMNDDLTGYHRQGANIEMAEERLVYDLVGEKRYREFVRAYSAYKSPPLGLSEDAFVAKVRATELVSIPDEIDDADRAAVTFFCKVADRKEHLLIYNGALHDISRDSAINKVGHDSEKLAAVIRVGKPMIFIHNHPPDGTVGMFPSANDFEVAGHFQFILMKENPALKCEFRVMALGDEIASVSYGFKKSIVNHIKENAQVWSRDATHAESCQGLLERSIYDESFEYLIHACPVDLNRPNPEICTTHPKYFLWPSDKYFLKYRGMISVK